MKLAIKCLKLILNVNYFTNIEVQKQISMLDVFELKMTCTYLFYCKEVIN